MTPDPVRSVLSCALPAALAVTLGVAWQAVGGSVATAASGSLLLLVAALTRRPWAARNRPRHGACSLSVTLLLAALLLPIGTLRAEQRAARVDPLAPLVGRTVELTGRSDGRMLYLDDVGSVVALRPTGVTPRGRVRVRGQLEAAEPARNPGGFDERAWLRQRGGSAILRNVTVMASASDGDALRGRLREALTSGVGEEVGLLLRALVLGEREDARELRDLFARAGMAHLLALSGLHLGVLAGALTLLLAPLGRQRGWVLALSAAAFTVWIGPTPSLVRAAIMTAAVGVTMALGRGRPEPVRTLSLAALVTLLARPDWLFDLGFRLSYLALLGILAWGVPLAERITPPPPASTAGWDRRFVWRIRTIVTGGFAISTAAWFAGIPWVLSAFGEVTALAPFINIPAVPLTSLLLPTAMLEGLLGAVHPILATPVQLLTEPLARALLGLATLAADLPHVTWGAVAPVGQATFLLGTLPWAWTLRRRLAAWRAASITAAALATSLVLAAWGPGALEAPELIALDVGQGDAFLLRTPTGETMLVDGGGTPFSDYDVGAQVVVPALRALGVHHLDWVISTHADMDHAEGLVSILRAIPVGALGYGHARPDRTAWQNLEATAIAQKIPRFALHRGHVLQLGDVTLHVLHPTATRDPSHDDANAESVVLRIDWRDRPWAVLTGDVPSEIERDIALPPLEVLIAPHHGSAHSTSERWLRAATPRTVVISVGRNRYGHPARSVLERVEAVGAEVLRTDLHGAIRLQPSW